MFIPHWCLLCGLCRLHTVEGLELNSGFEIVSQGYWTKVQQKEVLKTEYSFIFWRSESGIKVWVGSLSREAVPSFRLAFGYGQKP